jgi:hypothetical protein
MLSEMSQAQKNKYCMISLIGFKAFNLVKSREWNVDCQRLGQFGGLW